MSIGDVTIVGGGAVTPVSNFLVDDRDTSSQTETIKPGEPVQLDNENFVEIIATGNPLQSGTTQLVGIAQNESTEVAATNGVVDVAIVVPYVTLMKAKTTTVADIDTEAELLAIRNDAVAFDNVSNVITIDGVEGDDPNVHGLVILDGDINKGTLRFYAKPLATLYGRSV